MAKEPKVAVRFIANTRGSYCVGDVAAFHAAKANELVQAKAAVFLAPPASAVPAAAAPVAPAQVEAEKPGDALDAMNREELVRVAKDLGLEFDARLGEKRLRELLRKATSPDAKDDAAGA